MKKVLCILFFVLMSSTSVSVFAANGWPDYVSIENNDSHWAGQGYAVFVFTLETEGVEMTDIVFEIEGQDELRFAGPVGGSREDRFATASIEAQGELETINITKVTAVIDDEKVDITEHVMVSKFVPLGITVNGK